MSSSQSGNVLFYILIAVALLAALSYAVSSSGRGSAQQITGEKARLYATELIEYTDAMATGVAQLRLRGVALNSLCFDHARWGTADYNHAACGDDRNRIFHPDGAGLAWVNASEQAMDADASPDRLWHIYADNEVQDVGTTSGTAEGAELILLVDELDVSVCQQINGLLGVTDPDAAPPVDTGYGTMEFAGSFGYSETIGDEDAALAGKTSACFQKTSNPAKYAFYKVLSAR